MTRCFKGPVEAFLDLKPIRMLLDETADSYAHIREKLDEIQASVVPTSSQYNESHLLLSPQFSRKLLHLVELKPTNRSDHEELYRCVMSTFNRLLLELIQAHFHSKHREREFLRIVKKVGCTLDYPQLIDAVIDRLLKLYRAADKLGSRSFERTALNRYLQKELAHSYPSQKIERTLQTIYWSDSFVITKQYANPCRLALKEDLYSPDSLRDKLDEKMIQLALKRRIRLTPESFAFLLYGTSNQALISRMQSILNRQHSPVTVEELKRALSITNDKYNIRTSLNRLKEIEDLGAEVEQKGFILTDLEELVCRLAEIKGLFSLRQIRKPIGSMQPKLEY